MVIRASVAGVVALAATLALAGCVAESIDSSTASPSRTPGPAPSLAGPTRPASTVEPWPDHGDFALDSNKAIVPAYNLSVEERWDDYDHLLRIANTPQARWVGSWEDDTRVAGLARDVYKKAAASDRIGLIAYQGMRDYPCERAAADASLELAYRARTEAVVKDLPDSEAHAWIVLEPALLQTLGSCAGDPRGAWLGDAAQILATAGAVVYLDATGLAQQDPEVAAALAATLDLDSVSGFALNSGQHRPTAEQLVWGEEFLAGLAAQGVDTDSARSPRDPGQPGLGLIIDSSRNGVPLEGEQCNAPDAGIGAAPRLVGEGVLDALVWIKRPGESDGPCNGGFAVGQFDQAKALELARRGVAEEGV
jgi:endoglucanase